MVFDILTTFPESLSGPLDTSILGRARERGLVSVRVTNIRDFATGRHRTTDDAPFGGGAGMVMKPEPLVAAIEHVESLPPGPGGLTIILSPQGERLSQGMAERLAEEPRLVLVCGHYEGIDERVYDLTADLELSIGDWEAELHRGKASVFLGLYEEALSALERAYSINPREPLITFELAYVYRLLGRKKHAHHYGLLTRRLLKQKP